MKLIVPSIEYKESWDKAMKAFDERGEKGFWNVESVPTDCEGQIRHIQDAKQGKNLPDGWVPATTYWLVDNDEFIGHVNIRHELNEWLSQIGGHIGYAIAPAHRGKGYGTKMLELVLPKAAELGLTRVMMSCDDTNIASRKIIERSGAEYEGPGDWNGTPIRRYWLDIPPSVG